MIIPTRSSQQKRRDTPTRPNANNAPPPPSLAKKYPDLKALRVELGYFGPEGPTRTTGNLKYTVNIEQVAASFFFPCSSTNCQAGGYELGTAVKEAVTLHRKSAEGQIHCPGARERLNGGKAPCENLMHYKLTITYV